MRRDVLKAECSYWVGEERVEDEAAEMLHYIGPDFDLIWPVMLEAFCVTHECDQIHILFIFLIFQLQFILNVTLINSMK